MLEKTQRTTKNGQYRETGKTQNKDKQNKNTTQKLFRSAIWTPQKMGLNSGAQEGQQFLSFIRHPLCY
jgi:hypothetical protein